MTEYYFEGSISKEALGEFLSREILELSALI